MDDLKNYIVTYRFPGITYAQLVKLLTELAETAGITPIKVEQEMPESGK